eukprot:TRINITY_DN2132_c0_g1_i12.p1 TRINITY_DN2132_c0_g1~~TRINITY_DN2132_c0_g1_i12.p1  ORF type:complete len:208 (-),score=59.26 TRINITY_DN2132_c0_g1_i12:34-657(-)
MSTTLDAGLDTLKYILSSVDLRQSKMLIKEMHGSPLNEEFLQILILELLGMTTSGIESSTMIPVKSKAKTNSNANTFTSWFFSEPTEEETTSSSSSSTEASAFPSSSSFPYAKASKLRYHNPSIVWLAFDLYDEFEDETRLLLLHFMSESFQSSFKNCIDASKQHVFQQLLSLVKTTDNQVFMGKLAHIIELLGQCTVSVRELKVNY